MTTNNSFPAFQWNPTAESLEQQKDDLMGWGEEHLPKNEKIEFFKDQPYHLTEQDGEIVNAVPIKENDWLVLITPENDLVIFPDAHIRNFFVIE